MATSTAQLKEYFKALSKPTESQFAQLIDAFIHRDDDITTLIGSMAEVNEAEDGAVTDRYMSPYLTKKAIIALTRLANISALQAEVQVLIDAHASLTNNPHEVTKAQVGLSNLPNATSDSYGHDSSDHLATAKAVHDLQNVIMGQLNMKEPEITPKGTAFNKSFGVIAGSVAEGNHTHGSLEFGGTKRVETKVSSVEITNNMDISSKVDGDPVYINLRPTKGSGASRAILGRELANNCVSLRVDKSDGDANYGGLYQFKENGDVTFSSLDNRIRDRETGTVIGSTSDKRLKRAIKTIEEDVADKVMQLRPVKFLFKNNAVDNEKTVGDRIGFISQEVELLFPELVDESEKGYKSIDYPKMTVLLTKTIQEQQLQIASLTAKMIEIESRLNGD